METKMINDHNPPNFISSIKIKNFSDGSKVWLKDEIYHREDGPAVEYTSGRKSWYLEGKYYERINLKNFVILDSYKGKYGLMWYKLLDKDEIIEYPDIPGLITK